MTPRKKKKEIFNDGKTCIIHFEDSKDLHFTQLNEDRFQKIQSTAALRQRLPQESSEAHSKICANIPDTSVTQHGYHKECYRRFTKHLDRLKSTETETKSTSTKKVKRRFNDDCIFCGKKSAIYRKKRGLWSKESTKKFTLISGEKTMRRAESKQDENLLRRIRYLKKLKEIRTYSSSI